MGLNMSVIDPSSRVERGSGLNKFLQLINSILDAVLEIRARSAGRRIFASQEFTLFSLNIFAPCFASYDDSGHIFNIYKSA